MFIHLIKIIKTKNKKGRFTKFLGLYLSLGKTYTDFSFQLRLTLNDNIWILKLGTSGLNRQRLNIIKDLQQRKNKFWVRKEIVLNVVHNDYMTTRFVLSRDRSTSNSHISPYLELVYWCVYILVCTLLTKFTLRVPRSSPRWFDQCLRSLLKRFLHW